MRDRVLELIDRELARLKPVDVTAYANLNGIKWAYMTQAENDRIGKTNEACRAPGVGPWQCAKKGECGSQCLWAEGR